MDQKFDSLAPIVGVEITDKTTCGVDKEDETAAEAKADDLVAEKDKECAQTMNVEEDTATAENTSTKIINKDGITTARTEATEDVLHFKTGESKVESYARYYDYIKKATEKSGWTHKDWRSWAGDKNYQLWGPRSNRRRHQHQDDRR